jgi:hypothetical protein
MRSSTSILPDELLTVETPAVRIGMSARVVAMTWMWCLCARSMAVCRPIRLDVPVTH